jgi:hypothetical protein
MYTSNSTPKDPAYIRMPRTGTACPYSSLSRSGMDLIVRPQKANNFRPPVKSKIFRHSPTAKGIRLVDFRSLMNYLGRLPETQPGKEEVTAK